MLKTATRHYWVIKIQDGRYLTDLKGEPLFAKNRKDAEQYSTKLTADRVLKKYRKAYPTHFMDGSERAVLIKLEEVDTK